MKKHLLAYFIVLAFTFSGFITLHAQGIHVVPNPTAPNGFTYNNSGALSGYSGTPIILNNSLVLEYNPTITSDPMQIKQQLAVYTGGDSLHLIPNPDTGQGVYFNSIQLIFNNKLFFIYLNAAGIQQLASFDGTSITLYPNPDAGLGYIGSPRIFNNTLYVAYSNAAQVTQFGTFNGSGITLIPNPDNSSDGFFNDYSVVFNNKICSRYITADGSKHIATYDGTSWTILPNPDNSTRGFYPAFPINYHNKLYIMYVSTVTNKFQYMQYDGVNNPTLIPNPQNAGTTLGGVSGFPIIYNDTLFFQYYDSLNVYRLAKFGGTSINLVPNPDATPNGFYNTPIIYNNNSYIFYVTADNLHHLAQYQGASNSLKVYPNPDGGPGYWDQPIVYDNNLYFEYVNAQSRFQLGYFDGTSIKLISNPSGVYNGYGNTNGYVGYPIIWNNLLYMQFGSVPYNFAGNLAYFDGIALPITLLSFTAQPDAGTSLLQWKTASEVNNAYFTVEHSSDGTTFESIGTVTGHGTVTILQAYRFTDNTPSKGLNYYRLKQVDYDGHFTYSNIATVNFANVATAFKIFPNPAVNSINISLPAATVTSVIQVYDLSGKKVMEKQIGANTVSKSLDVSMLPAGVYQIRLMQGTQQQTIKLVKE